MDKDPIEPQSYTETRRTLHVAEHMPSRNTSDGCWSGHQRLNVRCVGGEFEG